MREREQDVLLLAEHFLKHFGLTDQTAGQKVFPGGAAKIDCRIIGPATCANCATSSSARLILETTAEIQAASLPDFQIETGLRKAAARQQSHRRRITG